MLMATLTSILERHAFWILISCALIWGTVVICRDPVQIGGDEGMEFSKAVLVARSSADVPRVWNDQPWLYSYLFGWMFRLLGFHAALPRLLALACTLAFLICADRLIPDGRGTLLPALTAVLFFSFPGVLDLTVSAMCELPATLLGVLGCFALLRPWPRYPVNSGLAGGILLGLAIEIKLTALMAFGAATLTFWLWWLVSRIDNPGPGTITPSGVRYSAWLAGAAIVIGVAALFVPQKPTELLWVPHVRATTSMLTI